MPQLLYWRGSSYRMIVAQRVCLTQMSRKSPTRMIRANLSSLKGMRSLMNGQLFKSNRMMMIVKMKIREMSR